MSTETKAALKLPLRLGKFTDSIFDAENNIVATVYEERAADVMRKLNSWEALKEACQVALGGINEEQLLQAGRGESVAAGLGIAKIEVIKALALAEKGEQ